jgi:transcriptional regulator with XRE-family HTH domain
METIRLLQAERERQNLSNYAVSQNSGVSESMLSLVDRGLRNPTLELLLRIADGIGSDLPALIQSATDSVTKKARAKSSASKKRE